MSKQFNNQEFFKEIIEILHEGKTVSFLVKGTSMKPLLPEKTEVFLRQVDKYSKKDICLFQYQGKFLLHRLKKVENNKYFFQGDNSNRIEEVGKDLIYGKVYQYILNNKTYKPHTFSVKVKLFGFLVVKKVKKIIKYILRGFKK
jgi:phage repressor protein C with HTH and peptisase S24 domain